MRRPTSLRLSENHEFFQINPTETRYLYDEIFVRHVYGNGRPLVLPENALVVDVGANIGLFTRYVLERQPTAQVLSIEPAPACYDVLLLNTEQLPAVTALRYAAAEVAGEVAMAYYPGYTMMSTVHPDATASADLIRRYTENTSAELPAARRVELLDRLPDLVSWRLAPQMIEVEQVRLESVLDERYRDRPIDFLKVDVEGAEVAALAGLGTRGQDLRSAVIEVQGAEAMRSVQAILADWGLDLAVEQDPDYAGTDLFVVHAHRPGAGN